MICSNCNLPGEFYPRGTKKGWCKKCVHKDNYRRNLERKGREQVLADGRKWKNSNKGKVSLWNSDYRQRLKRQVVAAYGGMCACCAEKTLEFLSVDHINNDGKAHRQQVPGARLLNWLIKHSYPAGFQILCFNCNLAKAMFGVCPHERARNVALVQ